MPGKINISDAVKLFKSTAQYDKLWIRKQYGGSMFECDIEAFLRDQCSYDPDGFGYNCYLEIPASQTKNGSNPVLVVWFDSNHPHNE